jgi:hypothetical protein
MARRWPVDVGAAYLLLAQFVTFNVVLVGWSFGPTRWLLHEQAGATGRPGLVLLGLLGIGVAAVTLWSRGLTRLQWALAAAVSAWSLAPLLSMFFLGSLDDWRFLWVSVATTAVIFAGALVPSDVLRRLLYGLGWFYGWGSVAAGLSQVLLGWPKVLVGGQERYAQWLNAVGIPVDDVASLNGLTPGRLFLAMNCGVLLVYVLRTQRLGDWRSWIMPTGLLLALAWSFGRVGMLAAVLGLLASLIPWEKGRALWPFLIAVAIFLTPLIISRLVDLQPGTTQWRFDLWAKYFGNRQLWQPFGLGPQAPPDPIRGHAHNQALETLASGGWIGLAGLLAFLYLACVVGVRSAPYDRRVTIGIVFAMAGIFASDVLTFAPTFTVLNGALVVALAVLATSAGQPSPPHPRLLGKTPDPVDSQPKD